MKYKEMLYSKNGLSTMALAKLFLGLKEGEKIPTVTELNDKIDLARGTIQNSIKMLQSQGAIPDYNNNLRQNSRKKFHPHSRWVQ